MTGSTIGELGTQIYWDLSLHQLPRIFAKRESALSAAAFERNLSFRSGLRFRLREKNLPEKIFFPSFFLFVASLFMARTSSGVRRSVGGAGQGKAAKKLPKKAPRKAVPPIRCTFSHN
jgi:hypothetical protein